MQTDNKKNEMNRIDDVRRTDGSRIAGLGHSAGCTSPVSQREQKTSMEPIAKPQEDQRITREVMRKPQEEPKIPGKQMGKLHEEQTTSMGRTGKLPEATGQDTGRSRKRRPVVAIREAKRRAALWGFTVADIVSEDGLPYDFIAMKDGITSFIRIRRIRDSWFDIKRIQERCRKEIAGFRAMKQQQGLIFELWIRGFARAFHRYRVLPDAIEKIGIVLEPETRAGKKALDDEQRAGTAIVEHDDRERVAGETVPAIPDTASP